MLEHEQMDVIKKSLQNIIVKSITINPFYKGDRIAIDIREYQGAKVGKSESISFKCGISPKELKDIIINSLRD